MAKAYNIDTMHRDLSLVHFLILLLQSKKNFLREYEYCFFMQVYDRVLPVTFKNAL